MALALGGCGRFGFGENDPPTDGTQPDDVADDVPADVGGPLGPFGSITHVTELAAPLQDDDPTLPADMLEIFFDSERPGGPTAGLGDIWVATRSAITQPFGPPVLVAELASLEDDTSPDITPDGLTMYFGSERASPGDRDLYVTTRPDRTSPWSAPIRLGEIATSLDESSAIESTDRLTLLYASSQTGMFALYTATRSAVGQPWGGVTRVMEISASGLAASQHWANGDLTLVYFNSIRAGESLDDDIYVASRPDRSVPFGTPVLVSELSAPGIDADAWLSPDLRTLYFMSKRAGGGDIFVATR